MNNRGKFIVLCGIDGSGKSTIQDELNQIYNAKEIVNIKHPPKEWYENSKIITTFITEEDKLMDDLEEVEYTTRLRMKEQEELIIPELNRGRMVLSHRYIFSLYSYYYMRGTVGYQELMDITKEIIEPDLTFYLKVSMDEFYRRKYDDLIKFQQDKTNVLKTIECYEIMTEAFGFKVIDTEKLTIAETVAECCKHIEAVNPTIIQPLESKLAKMKWPGHEVA